MKLYGGMHSTGTDKLITRLDNSPDQKTKTKGKGRPKTNKEDTAVVGVRLPLSMIAQLKRQAKSVDRSVPYIIRNMVNRVLESLGDKEDKQMKGVGEGVALVTGARSAKTR